MRTYSTKKIRKLYDSIEEHLTVQEQEIVREIIGDFNNLITYANEQKKYIEYKKDDWLEYMNENHKLKQENKELKEKVDNLKQKITIIKETFKNS